LIGTGSAAGGVPSATGAGAGATRTGGAVGGSAIAIGGAAGPGAGAGAGAPGEDAGGVRPGTPGPIGCGSVGGCDAGAPLAGDAAARQAGGFAVPFGGPIVNVADLWNVTPGIRALAASDCAGYVATTVAVDPAVAPWHAHDSQCVASIRFATTEPPVTAMSKSPIVTR
jgi:hypothetical protein